MAQILVTGGTGYIGSHTVVELLAAGHSVVIVDNLCNSVAGVVDRIEKIAGQRPQFVQADLRDRKAIDNFAGLRFRDDCWGLRAVVRRSVSTRSGQLETGVYLQFELTGLSSVGTGADTFLQQSIQGYSAAKEIRQAQPIERQGKVNDP